MSRKYWLNQKPFRGVPLDRAHPFARGLLVCCLFNELTGDIIYDYTGNNNIPTLINGPSWDHDSIKCESGSSQYLEFPARLKNQLEGTDLTILMEFKHTESTVRYEGLFVTMGPAAGYFGIAFLLGDNSNNPYLGLYTDTGGYVWSSRQLPTQNEWYRIGLTLDASYCNFFIDGLPETPQASGYATSHGTNPRMFRSAEHLTYTNGWIRWLYIYNRKLSDADIGAII